MFFPETQSREIAPRGVLVRLAPTRNGGAGMYSVILTTMLLAGGEAPSWGWHSCHGCHCYGCGCGGCHCYGCHCYGCGCGGCHCYGCHCYGCSCYGCHC